MAGRGGCGRRVEVSRGEALEWCRWCWVGDGVHAISLEDLVTIDSATDTLAGEELRVSRPASAARGDATRRVRCAQDTEDMVLLSIKRVFIVAQYWRNSTREFSLYPRLS